LFFVNIGFISIHVIFCFPKVCAAKFVTLTIIL